MGGFLKKLKKLKLKDLDPNNKNSALREELKRFDESTLQPLWEDAAWALLPAELGVGARVYIENLDKQASGKYKALPVWLRIVLDDLDAYDLGLSASINDVFYAENIDTKHGMAITIGDKIYFPSTINLNSQTSYSSSNLFTMLHELEHVVQYKRNGGVGGFLAKYFVQSLWSALTSGTLSVVNIHDNIELEKQAEDKANGLIERVTEEARELPVSFPLAVSPLVRSSGGGRGRRENLRPMDRRLALERL